MAVSPLYSPRASAVPSETTPAKSTASSRRPIRSGKAEWRYSSPPFRSLPFRYYYFLHESSHSTGYQKVCVAVTSTLVKAKYVEKWLLNIAQREETIRNNPYSRNIFPQRYHRHFHLPQIWSIECKISDTIAFYSLEFRPDSVWQFGGLYGWQIYVRYYSPCFVTLSSSPSSTDSSSVPKAGQHGHSDGTAFESASESSF